jgi:hypothetical protein
MTIKVITKTTLKKESVLTTPQNAQNTNPLKVPVITGSPKRTPNIIIRAVKIMLMDIRMALRPRQTAEELERYSQFSNLVYGRK